ncbi:MAG: hypothetical protein IKK64_07430 [Bacteroidales bacterium]|nr:hypothetical protein [Bacteroidales bacterium]
MTATDEFLKYQDKLVAGEDVSGYKFSGEVTQMPKQFNEWVKNNTSRLENAQSIPYFLKDNPKYSGITPRLGSTPTYAGTKFGRTATKQAYQEYKDATPPILTKEQQDNINDIANELGVKVKPMNFWEANEGRSNIYYNRGGVFKDNCQCCVVVHEMRLRGIDATSVGYDYGKESIPFRLGERFQDIWINPKTGKIPQPTILRDKTDDALYIKLDKATEVRGRYHIGINGIDNTGHMITAERLESGRLIFYDAQSGDFVNIKEYTKLGYLEVLKVDKLIFNKSMICKILQII